MSAFEDKASRSQTQEIPSELTQPSTFDHSETFSVAIRGITEEFDVQPILFMGAGISRRYIGAPDWTGALRFALEKLGDASPPYSYYVQKYGDDKIEIGTAIADAMFEWAWSKGKDQFDPRYFDSPDKHIFMKAVVSSRLNDLTPSEISSIPEDFAPEIAALRNIRPHAVITTNYDSLLEQIFEGYEPIVGRGVLKYDLNSFGEIFHIHGIASDPHSLVLTRPDYENWHRQSRYFAAKLLTYFIEHPIFIFGYGLGDPNVRTVLQDIGRIIAGEDGLISNVAQIVWHPELRGGPTQSEVVIDDEVDGRQYRIRVFNVTDLRSIFDMLTGRHELKQVNPALLRTLAARLMKLTRKDIPGGTVEVDYDTLEGIARNDEILPKMLGLTFADTDNKTHPLTLTQVAEALGLKGFNHCNPLIRKIKADTGIDLRASDNRYHERIKTGTKETSYTRKWSQDAVSLFRCVLERKNYDLKL